jgi:hypothetical protein
VGCGIGVGGLSLSLSLSISCLSVNQARVVHIRCKTDSGWWDLALDFVY